VTAGNEKVESPLVTVLLSVYNGERFLRESVESILGQTFTDFEFLIVDDASTDSTALILTEYAGRESRIRLVHNPGNLGLTRSLNRGLALAAGKYVARQDADDVSLPERLQRQVEFLEEHEDIAVLGTCLEIIDEEGKLLATRRLATESDEIEAELLLKNNALLHTSVAIRKSALLETGGYDERIQFAQDYELWWRVSKKWKLANLPEVLVKWRESSQRISSVHRRQQLNSMFETSLKIVSERTGGKAPARQAYEKFWWAYHGYLDEFDSEDIKALTSLWDEVYRADRKMELTRSGMRQMAFNLIDHRRIGTGLALLRLIRERSGERPRYKTIVRHILKAFISSR